MRLWTTFRTALDALSVNRARTALTSLGITIGVAAVIAMVSAGTGAQGFIDDLFGSLGPNLIIVRPGQATNTGLQVNVEPMFTDKDVQQIREELGPLIVGAAAVSQVPAVARNESGEIHKTVLAGGDSIIFDLRQWKLAPGYPNNRFHTQEDTDRQAKVIVIGQTVKEALFPNVNPIGKTLRVEPGGRFKVVGLAETKGFAPNGSDQDDILMAPNSTVLRRVLGTDKSVLITVEAASSEVIPVVKERVEDILRSRRNIREGRDSPFRVISLAEYARLASLFTDVLSYLIYAIAAVSLVVGGIGVMNIMLVSVTERTREIGIRMAVGAKTKDVLNQFLTESIILALVGGACGIVIGLAIALGIAVVADWQFVVLPESIAIAVGSSTLVGIFFGYYPARKASMLNPIEALRYE